MTKQLNFLADFNKDTKKMEGVVTSAPNVKDWIDIGNHVINKVISNGYKRGIALGRLAMLAGPSGAGKSFLLANTVKSAQRQGYGIIVLDSEHALDDDFMTNIGVDTTDPNYIYRGVQTLQQTVEIISAFIKSYRKHNETTKFLIVIDSLDALLTDSMVSTFEDGEIKGDQGQHAKQIKSMLSPFMHEIKTLPIAILATKHVYKSQDRIELMNPATEWKLTDSVKFPFSQIILVSRLMLKDDETKKYEGIRLRVFGLKTRFTKPFQQAMIEVPYDEGLNPYSGLLEAALSVGIVTKSGPWYSYKDQKFQSSNFEKFQEQILNDLIENENKQALNVNLEDTVFHDENDKPSKKELLKGILDKIDNNNQQEH